MASDEEIWNGQFSTSRHPQFSTHAQVAKRKFVVPVVMGPKIHRSDRTPEEKELWAQDIVILFKPWRKPHDLKTNEQSWLDVAEDLLVSLSSDALRIIHNMNVLTECRDARD
ncbi:hypothetical protein DFH06DRAFT_1023825, partial [Mycena polygramma]